MSVDEDQDIPAAHDISMVDADMLAVLQRNVEIELLKLQSA
jgi:hypothetical protein